MERVEQAPPKPDPRVLQTTRRYLPGDVAQSVFGLTKPLHYVAATVAFAFAEKTWVALREEWGLGEPAIWLAVRGAGNLGLLSASGVTVKGNAYADTLHLMGFSLADSRKLMQRRLVTSAPNVAVVLRTLLLQHPTIDLIVRALLQAGRGPVPAEALATHAFRIGERLAQAVFGDPPVAGGAWPIRSTTRFQLKAALLDVGLLEGALARGAGRGTGYEPVAGFVGAGVRPHLPVVIPGALPE